MCVETKRAAAIARFVAPSDGYYSIYASFTGVDFHPTTTNVQINDGGGVHPFPINLLTASITTPAFVRYSRKNMEEGSRKAGKDPSQLVLGSVIVGSIARDSASGKEGAREQAAMYLANKVQNIRGSADVLLECAGLNFDQLRPIAKAMEQGGRKAAAKMVTDEILRKVCPIAGTPEECIDRIEEYREAGCTHIMLEIWGDDRTGQAKLFGDAVLPHIKR